MLIFRVIAFKSAKVIIRKAKNLDAGEGGSASSKFVDAISRQSKRKVCCDLLYCKNV